MLMLCTMRIYLSCMLVFLTAFQAPGQETEVALKAGLNVNDLGSSKVGMYNTVGFHVGMGLELIANSNFSLQPEIQYSQQGASPVKNRESVFVYNYINLPVLIKWYVIDDMDFHIGPQVGLLVSAQQKNDLGSANITEQVNGMDVAIVGGLHYRFHQKAGAVVRYNLGLSNTNEQRVIYENRLTNRVLQIGLHYFL